MQRQGSSSSLNIVSNIATTSEFHVVCSLFFLLISSKFAQSDLVSMALHPFRKYLKSQIDHAPEQPIKLSNRSHHNSVDPCAFLMLSSFIAILITPFKGRVD